jgi:hypothetical protein
MFEIVDESNIIVLELDNLNLLGNLMAEPQRRR